MLLLIYPLDKYIITYVNFFTSVKGGKMKKIAEKIVYLRKLILLVFLGLIVFSVFSINKVKIEYSITSYLPVSTDTKRALDIMDEEFVTYGTSTIFIRNISFEEAVQLSEKIKALEGVKDLPFENTEEYYKESSALFGITYQGTDEDELCVAAYKKVLELIQPYDALISTSLVDDYADTLAHDINNILFLAVIIIILVLLFTSKSFAEVIVFLFVFGVSALLNMGTNYWFGTISFISNSVCIILQLALAIDYAIILSHRFAEEKEKNSNPQEAMAEALSKAIIEISGSSLTTISGLLALCCMSLKLGADLGLVLAKSILCSMFTVFLFMPAVMLMFTKLIEKTTHRDFVPKISWFGKGILKVRFIIPFLFLILISVGTYFSLQTDYVYSQESIDTSRPTEAMQAKTEINRLFGSKNQFVVLVPKGDYAVEQNVVSILEQEELISDIIAISDVKITTNNISHYLIEEINYKEFANFIGMERDISKTIYQAYCYFSQDETKDGLKEIAVFEANPDAYMVSLLQMADCAFKYDDFIVAMLSEDEEALNNYYDIKEQITDAEDQLIGTNYTRIVCNIITEVEARETFSLIEHLNQTIKGYNSKCIFAGESMSAYDLNSSFSTDNILISVLTIVFVYIILIMTLKNWGLPILLVSTIQGAIFINFAIPALTHSNLFFFVYLIVSAIQMGATIDYAIVITTRFQELSKDRSKKEAVIETLNQAFPTILTSGVILSVAGFLIHFLVGDPLISTLGLALGRGTLISIASVMCVLPILLYFFYDKLKKTDLNIKVDKKILRKMKEKKNEKTLDDSLN